MSDGTDITTHTAGTAIAIPNAGNILAMVLDAARDPTISADNVKIMAELAMTMQDREKEQQFNRDLNAAKKEMPSIARDGAIKNNSGKIQSRFSSWEKLNPIVTEILARHNLTIGHDIGSTDKGQIAVSPFLTHDNGMVRHGKEMVFPPDTSGNKSAAQAVVSASSYGQRVTTIKLLNIRTHDAPETDGYTVQESQRLSPEQEAVVEAGRSAAMGGMVEYEPWFRALPTNVRAWLVDNGYHNRNKEAAANIDRSSGGQS